MKNYWLPFLAVAITATTGCRNLRDHHYNFAHRSLPHLFFENSLRVSQFLEKNGEEALRTLWAQCEGRNHEALPEGFTCVHRRAGDETNLVVVAYPPPTSKAEAYFSALVVHSGQPRYFTLEASFGRVGGRPRTVLAEWTAERAHYNYGDGPAPIMEAFVQAILERL